MHSYHQGKKPHDAIRSSKTCHYTQPATSCRTLSPGLYRRLAALLDGRRGNRLIDRSPAATFITKNSMRPVDVFALQKTIGSFIASIKPELDWLYATRCDRCGKEENGYTVFSQVFQCTKCLQRVGSLLRLRRGRRDDSMLANLKKITVCSHCHKKCLEEISTRGERFGSIPRIGWLSLPYRVRQPRQSELTMIQAHGSGSSRAIRPCEDQGD